MSRLALLIGMIGHLTPYPRRDSEAASVAQGLKDQAVPQGKRVPWTLRQSRRGECGGRQQRSQYYSRLHYCPLSRLLPG